MAAGFFFPGSGWWGMGALVALWCGGSVDKGTNWAVAVVFLVFLFLRDFPAETKTFVVPKVQVLNTSFGRVASGSGDFNEQFERERKVFRHIRQLEHDGTMSADIVILPETLLGRMNVTTKKRWERFFSRWTDKGTIFLIGAEIPTDRGMKYDNVMVAFDGSENLRTAKQRFPVPYSMFIPFSRSGANAYVTSFGDVSMLAVKGKNFGVLICYEQFLAWPFLTLLSQNPDAIIAPANMWWSRNTSLPCIQSRTLRAWGALFDIPFFISKND
jgi:apolipoprotein N-acyltransferase